MHLYAMEEHLTKTWQMLVGEDLSFSAQAICSQALLAQHYFVVTLHPTPSGHLAGVGLAIAEQDARKLTSQMFDLPESELSADDIADACGELCNVFASGVPTHITDQLTLDLGLPSRLSHAQFLLILAASTVSGSYIAHQQDRHIQVIIFETLEVPAAAGWSPAT
ncbi:MAG: hypothetical protein WA173_17745 [Pseudomonas sp.]|uniref:hypothetical protein n=1 Tax=Pseudomonas sp. TaxID=306 RepID=UPI003BB7F3DD